MDCRYLWHVSKISFLKYLWNRKVRLLYTDFCSLSDTHILQVSILWDGGTCYIYLPQEILKKVPNHRTTSLHIRADYKLVTHHIFASVNNPLLLAIKLESLLVYILLNCLLWIKLISYFEGKLLTESVRKWGGMENISTSEEVMLSREKYVIWTYMTSTPRKMYLRW